MVKVITRICNILSTVILVAVIGIVGVLLAPRVFGYNALAVLSGSMEPVYHVGSVVYVKNDVAPEEIQIGDPIAFYRSDGMVATHRVTAVDTDNRQFTTKGDNNNVEDKAPVSFDKLIGRAGKSIPLLGYLIVNIKTKKGMIAAAGLLVFVILLYIIPEIMKPEKASAKPEGESKEE